MSRHDIHGVGLPTSQPCGRHNQCATDHQQDRQSRLAQTRVEHGMGQQSDDPSPSPHHETSLPTPQSRLKDLPQLSEEQDNPDSKHEYRPGPHLDAHLEIIVVRSLRHFSKPGNFTINRKRIERVRVLIEPQSNAQRMVDHLRDRCLPHLPTSIGDRVLLMLNQDTLADRRGN